MSDAYRSGPPPTRAAIAARTHPGSKHKSNLDAYLVSDFEGYLARDYASLAEPATARAALALAVFSGHFLDWSRSPADADHAAEKGFRITRVAGDALATALASGAPPIQDAELRERLGQAISAAGWSVAQAARDRRFVDTAASCTLAVLQRDRLDLIQAGDTRGYLLRNGRLSLVSQGASPDGWNGPNGIRSAPLGVPAPSLPPLYSFDLRPGDVVLLCSRGLAATVSEGQLVAALLRSPSLEVATRAIIDEALARKPEHNLTVVMATPLSG